MKFFNNILSLGGVLTLIGSGVNGQYGFPGAPSPDVYLNIIESPVTPDANPFNTVVNATQSDETLSSFNTPSYQPTRAYLREFVFAVGPSFGNLEYTRQKIEGEGSFWQSISGVSSLVIDLRPNSPSYQVQGGQALTTSQFAQQGITFNPNGTVTYNITYVNQHDDLDIIHNHGQAAGWWVDGVPYLSANPLNSGEEQTYSYTIDPNHNSGTYFIHSHYGFNSLLGNSAPLIVQNLVDPNYPLAAQLNSPNITEVLLYLEDFCLVYTNADDAMTGNDNYTDYHTVHDRAICENPYLAYRAVFGEWNGNKGPVFLGYGPNGQPDQGFNPWGQGILDKCSAPTLAMEFGFSFFLANGATFDNPQLVQVSPGATVRLRIINAAKQTNFLVELPQTLSNSVVIAVDGHYVKPASLESFITGGTYSNVTVWAGIAQRVDIFFTVPMTPDVYAIIAHEEAPATGESSSPAFAPFEFSHTAGIILYSTSTLPPNNVLPDKVPGVGMLSVHPEYLINQNQALSAWTSELTSSGTAGGNTNAASDLTWTKNFNTASNVKRFTVPLTGYNGIFGINFNQGYQFPPMIPLTVPTLKQPFLTSSTDPSLHVAYGDRVCLTFVNYNWDSHPMHLHGHHFQVVDYNGVSFQGPVRDTVLVPAGNCNNVTVCFNANSKSGGVHGLHCHMAIHEMAGMFIPIVYDGYTPITTVAPTITSLANSSSLAIAQAQGLNPGGKSSSSSDDSFNNGVKAAAALFGILFLISLLVIAVLSYKLHQHIYSRQSDKEEVAMGNHA